MPLQSRCPANVPRIAQARTRVVVGLGLAVAAVLAVFTGSAAVLERFPGDLAASEWVQSWRTPWLDSAMEGVSVAGEMVTAGLIVAATAATLLILRRKSEASLIVAATLIDLGVRTTVKALVARPRPPADLVEVIREGEGFSFPSGHALHYAAFLGLLLLMLPSIVGPGPRLRVAQGILIAALVIVGFSRIYLGLHWLSDVIAGYAFGAVVAGAAAFAWWRLKARRDATPAE